MNNAIQPYGFFVQLNPKSAKGWAKLSRPLAAQQAAYSTRDALSRVEWAIYSEGVKIAHERYDAFDGQRRKAEAIEVDSTDMKALEQAEKQLTKKGGRDAS